MEKFNEVLLIIVKNCAFGVHQNYARHLDMGVLRGHSKIAFIKPHKMTHHPKGLKKVMTGENWVIYFNQKENFVCFKLTVDV